MVRNASAGLMSPQALLDATGGISKVSAQQRQRYLVISSPETSLQRSMTCLPRLWR